MKLISSGQNELTGQYLDDYIAEKEITAGDVPEIITFMEQNKFELSNLGISNELDGEDGYFRVYKTAKELLFYFPNEDVYLDNLAFRCKRDNIRFTLSFGLGTSKVEAIKDANYNLVPMLTQLEEYIQKKNKVK